MLRAAFLRPPRLRPGQAARTISPHRTIVSTVNREAWRRIVKLLIVHKEVYGHLHVPCLFRVPKPTTTTAAAKSPWPHESVGAPLGKWVMKMRMWRKSAALPTEVMPPPPPPQGGLGDGVCCGVTGGARAGHGQGHMDVSWCPDTDTAVRVNELDALGFPWFSQASVEADRWATLLLPSLSAFASFHGHLHVPKHFVVPHQHPALVAAGAAFDSPWPRQTWGYELGAHCQNLRKGEKAHWWAGLGCAEAQVAARADALARRNEAEEAYAKARAEEVDGLRYSRGGGGALIPAQGRREQRVSEKIKFHAWAVHEELVRTDAAGARRAALDAMGFVWCAQSWRWETFVVAVRTYSELYCATDRETGAPLAAHERVVSISKSFDVPARDSKAARLWPARTHGIALGARVVEVVRARGAYCLRCKGPGGQYPNPKPPTVEERRAELDALGFVWDKSGAHWEGVLAALRAFEALHGHVRVPPRFVVPCVATEQRRARRARAARRQRREAAAAAAAPAGFAEGGGLGDEGAPAGGAADGGGEEDEVEEEQPLPAHPFAGCVAGLALGDTVRVVRRVGYFLHGRPERVAALDELGFEWPAHLRAALDEALHHADGSRGLHDALRAAAQREARERWGAVQPALEAYREWRGDLMVPQNFVVPEDGSLCPPFAEAARGLKLGIVVNGLRMRVESQGIGLDDRERQLLQALPLGSGKEAYAPVLRTLKKWGEREGHFEVPADFVVPSESTGGLPWGPSAAAPGVARDRWPEAMWGIELGRHVAALRSSGHLAGGNRNLCEEMKAMGIVL